MSRFIDKKGSCESDSVYILYAYFSVQVAAIKATSHPD